MSLAIFSGTYKDRSNDNPLLISDGAYFVFFNKDNAQNKSR